MGQYYTHANIDKQEMCSPDGIKLMEHSWVGNRSVHRLYSLLKGDWKGDRVVVAGDYFEADENESIGVKLKEQIYDLEWDEPKLKTPEPTDKLVHEWEREEQTGFYVNYDKEQAIDLSKLPVQEIYNDHDWIVSPLTLMVACGNNRGGGDYYEGNQGYSFVGTWAGDHVGIEDELPEGYQLINPDFKEKR